MKNNNERFITFLENSNLRQKQILDFQEALKRPMKQKRKLRIFISNTAFPANEAPGAAAPTPAGEPGAPSPGPEGSATTCWELRVEGRLIDEEKKVSC